MTPSNRTPSRFSRRRLALGAGALAALIGLGGLVSAADARPWGHHRGPHHGGFFAGRMLHLVHELDLTEEQELEAVRMRRALREQGRAARKATVEDLRAAADELKKVTPDRDRLHGLVDQSIERMRKLAHAAVDRFLDFHAQLTPEQKAEVSERITEAQARMDKRRARMNDE